MQLASGPHLRTQEPDAPHELAPVAQQLLDELEVVEAKREHQVVLNRATVRGRGQRGEHLRAEDGGARMESFRKGARAPAPLRCQRSKPTRPSIDIKDGYM